MTMMRIERLAGLLAVVLGALAVTLIVTRVSVGEEMAGMRSACFSCAVERAAVALRLRAPARPTTEQLQIAEAADPKNPAPYVDLARAYAKSGDLQSADAQYRAALAVAPRLRGVHAELADLEMREGLTAAALSDYAVEGRLSPGDAHAHAGFARAHAMLAPGAWRTRRTAHRPRATPRRDLVRRIAAARPSAAPIRGATPAPTAAPARTARPLRARTPVPATSVAPAGGAPVWGRIGPDNAVGTHANLGSLSREAGQYLLGVTQDINFTGALPAADPEQTKTALQRRLATASRDPRGWSEDLAKIGTSALSGGYADIATSAFRMLANAEPRDWRGVYFLGLTSQYQGDNERALSYFALASARASRADVLTSVAIIRYRTGDIAGARSAASQATSTDRSFEPAYFVSGMLSLIDADVPSAQRDLSTAVSLGPAPAKTQYFIDSLRHD